MIQSLKENVHSTMSGQIAEKIKNKILNGEFRENTPLREMELSNVFNVSRGPVRDALRILSKEGLVIAEPNIGVKVAPHPSAPVLEAILNIRKELESLAMDEVFDTLCDEDIENLKIIVQQLKVACTEDDIYKIANLDIAFHRFFVEKYEDKHLLDLWLNIINRMMFRYNRIETMMEIYIEHEMILEMIIKKNKRKAIGFLLINIQ